MTKQEVIKQAYGEYWDKVKDFVNENGWCDVSMYSMIKNIKPEFSEIENEIGQFDIRPISLKGIENNNGWIKIESENDLPKDDYTLCHYIVNGKIEIGEYMNLHFDRPKQNELFYYKSVTHYQPIVKPQPPLY